MNISHKSAAKTDNHLNYCITFVRIFYVML